MTNPTARAIASVAVAVAGAFTCWALHDGIGMFLALFGLVVIWRGAEYG